MKRCILFFFLFLSELVNAQQDSIRSKRLDELVIQSQRIYDIDRLPDVQATYLWVGKKNEVINVQSTDANIAERTPRRLLI